MVVDNQVNRPKLERYTFKHTFNSSAVDKVPREADRRSAFPAELVAFVVAHDEF